MVSTSLLENMVSSCNKHVDDSTSFLSKFYGRVELFGEMAREMAKELERERERENESAPMTIPNINVLTQRADRFSSVASTC